MGVHVPEDTSSDTQGQFSLFMRNVPL